MSSLPPESAPARVSPNAAPLFTLQFPADALFAAPLAGLVGELATRHGLGETRTGQLVLAAEEVVAYLSAFPNVHYYKGFFPDSATGKEPEKQSYR